MPSFFRSRIATTAAALLTMVLANGCITHPPDAVTPTHEHNFITHPPDRYKEGPAPKHQRRHHAVTPPRVGATPAPITHPGE